MSKGGGQQTVTSVPDSATQQYVQTMRQYALGQVFPQGAMGGLGPSGQGADPAAIDALRARGGIWGGLADKLQASGVRALGGTPVPLPPAITQAQGQYGQYANAGQQGLAALTGGPNPFMNTYLNQMNPFFAQQRAQAVQGANDQAAQAGAFGGDRSQITALLAGNQADQTQAGFNYQGFNDAQQRALQAAQLGYGATGLAAFLPQQYASGQLGLLQQALGPYGQTTSQPLYRNPIAGAAGGAIAGGSLFGPPGAIIGGIGGLFG